MQVEQRKRLLKEIDLTRRLLHNCALPLNLKNALSTILKSKSLTAEVKSLFICQEIYFDLMACRMYDSINACNGHDESGNILQSFTSVRPWFLALLHHECALSVRATSFLLGSCQQVYTTNLFLISCRIPGQSEKYASGHYLA